MLFCTPHSNHAVFLCFEQLFFQNFQILHVVNLYQHFFQFSTTKLCQTLRSPSALFRALHHLSGPMPKTSDDARIQQILATDVFEHVAELRRDRTSNSSSEDSAEMDEDLKQYPNRTSTPLGSSSRPRTRARGAASRAPSEDREHWAECKWSGSSDEDLEPLGSGNNRNEDREAGSDNEDFRPSRSSRSGQHKSKSGAGTVGRKVVVPPGSRLEAKSGAGTVGRKVVVPPGSRLAALGVANGRTAETSEAKKRPLRSGKNEDEDREANSGENASLAMATDGSGAQHPALKPHELQVLQTLAEMRGSGGTIDDHPAPVMEEVPGESAPRVDPSTRFIDKLHGWLAVEQVLHELSIVQCDGAPLLSKAGRNTSKGVTYRFNCGFSKHGCKWVAEVDVFTELNRHSDVPPRNQEKKHRSLHHANHWCQVRVLQYPHSNHHEVSHGPVSLFKARANINPEMLKMTRHQIQKWINAQGLKIPADRIDKVLNINKRYGERQRRQQLRTAAGLPAGMKTTTVASLQHCIQQNSFEVVSKQPTFSVHSAYVVPGSEVQYRVCIVMTTFNLILNAARATYWTPGGLRLMVDHSYMIKDNPNLTVMAVGPDGRGHLLAVAAVDGSGLETNRHCMQLVKTHAQQVLQFYQSQGWHI